MSNLRHIPIPTRYENASFDNSKGIKELPDSCLLLGPVGCGKTYLVWCKIKQLYATVPRMTNSYNVNGDPNLLFTTLPNLLLDVRACFDPEATTRDEEIIKAHCTCDYLILDDLGAEKTTDFARSILYQIIDYRYNYEKPTIITSNLDIKEISERFDDRIASRIISLCPVITLDNKDYRTKGLN
mgnify:FL=1